MTPEIALSCTWIDFVFSVLPYSYNSRYWQALQKLVQNCGWIFIANNTCIICDRPTKIFLDENGELHNEGKPALEYADGCYVAYAYHGLTLPEKYRLVPPSQWQPRWILLEENRQLQKILFQGIGIERIRQELSLVELERGNNYTLFKLGENTGVKAIHILQKANINTGELQAVLVSWSSTNLKRAIKYARDKYSAEEFPLPK